MTATTPQLLDWPVSTLSISDLNPRRELDPEGIETLAESIRLCGLMQNLAGLRDADGKVAIVAGGRRLRALQKLIMAGEGPDTIPVLVTEDAAQARAWAMAENTARSDLNPADEITAYARMAAEGIAPPAIAAAFAVSEPHVQRRLRLAALPQPALDALRARKISISQAGALTLARGTHQLEEMLGLAVNGGRSADSLRNLAMSEVISSADRRARFVGLDAYQAAGGALTRDLFSDAAVIEDVALLERLFAEKVDATREQFLQKGWKWAEFIDGTYIPFGYGEKMHRLYGDLNAAQRAHSGVAFIVDVDGRCDLGRTSRNWAGGFVRREDREAAMDAGVIERPATTTSADEDSASKAEGAGYSAALLADLRAARLHAFQSALLDNRALAMELIGHALSPCAGYGQSLLDVAVRRQKTEPDKSDGFTPDARLVDGRALGERVPWSERVVADPEDKIVAALVPALTYGLSVHRSSEGAALLAEIEAEIEARLRTHWTPTKEGFFARVPSAELDTIYAGIFALSPGSEDARSFSRMKKAEKANLLHMLFNADEATRRAYRLMTDDAMARIRAWAPEFD